MRHMHKILWAGALLLVLAGLANIVQPMVAILGAVGLGSVAELAFEE